MKISAFYTRTLTGSILMIAFAAALLPARAAEPYPSKPIRVIFGFNPGSTPDVMLRVLAPPLSKNLGQPIVIESRPGAGGAIAVRAVAETEPDGYMLFFGTTVGQNPLFLKEGAVVAGRDLSPVGDLGEGVFYYFVRSSLGARSVQELIAYSKANPNKLNFGGQNPFIDLGFEMVKAKTGITATTVPFKGPPIAEMLNGDIDIYGGSIATVLPHIQSGKLTILLATARLDVAPQAPLPAELGLPPLPGFRYGLWGPGRLPAEIRNRLASATAEAMKDPEVVERWKKFGFLPLATSPDDQLRFYNSVVGFYTEAARLVNFKPQ